MNVAFCVLLRLRWQSVGALRAERGPGFQGRVRSFIVEALRAERGAVADGAHADQAQRAGKK